MSEIAIENCHLTVHVLSSDMKFKTNTCIDWNTAKL